MGRLTDRLKRLALRQSDGTMTAFTSMVLVPVVAAVFIAGQAGIHAYRTAAARSRLQYAVMSAAASYDRDLLENYGLYGVTGEAAGERLSLTGRLDGEAILKNAVRTEGWRLAGSGILERMISKIKDIAGKYASAGAIDSLKEAADQVIELSWSEITAVVGANMPEFDVQNVIKAVKNLIDTLIANNVELDDSWLWKKDGRFMELDITGILDQSIVMLMTLAEVNWFTIGDKTAYLSYIMEYFSRYGSGAGRTAVLTSSEAEYCAFGNRYGFMNLASSFNYIIKLRMAINTLDYLMTLKAEDPSALIVCSVILGIFATASDAVNLLANDSIAVSPHFEYMETDYDDYLIMILLGKNNDMVFRRIADVINMNLAADGGSLEDYFTVISAEEGGELFEYAYTQQR